MTRRIHSGVVVGVVVCAVLARSVDAQGYESDHDQVRADVIECEDAVARLIQCCPDFDATNVRCIYSYSSGCGPTSTTSPALSRAESACVRNTDCDALRTTKVCERAALARESTVVDDEKSDAAPWKPPPSPVGSASSAPVRIRPVCP